MAIAPGDTGLSTDTVNGSSTIGVIGNRLEALKLARHVTGRAGADRRRPLPGKAASRRLADR